MSVSGREKRTLKDWESRIVLVVGLYYVCGLNMGYKWWVKPTNITAF